MKPFAKRQRTFYLFVGALGLIGVALGGTFFKAEAGNELTAGTVSVLNRPTQASDKLPPAVLALPSARQFRAGGRLAQVTTRGDSLYVVPGEANDICLVIVRSDEITTDCASRSILRTAGLILSESDDSGTSNVFGIVDNSVVDAAGVAPRSNTFAAYGVNASAVTVRTATDSRTLDLGSP